MSKLFIENGKGKKPSLECTALVLNVNYEHNKELMERCKTLKEYAQFIAEIRKNLACGMNAWEAVELAVDECIRNNILAEILRKNRGEIVDSILTEWDEDEYREFLKEESWKEGIKLGEERGKIAGKIEAYREFQLSKESTLERILKEFSLEEEEAKKYMEEYWK